MKKILAILFVLILSLSCAYAEDMTVGSRGDDVAAAQQQLIASGYLSGSADGIFGEKTAAAVRLFQYLNQLPQTGVIDETTRQTLLSDSARTLRPSLSGGDEGDAVAELQQALIRYGFLSGSADGIFGEKTWNAVYAFQQHLIQQGIDENSPGGVSATGEATGLTQEYLFSATYSSYLHDVAPGASDDNEVRRIERRLIALGYLDASSDTVYDDYAVSAVRAFQENEGLDATGTADRVTVDQLFAEDAAVAEHWVAHDVALGDCGEVIREAQQRLIQYGFLSGVADGEYGSGMEAALERLHSYLAGTGSARAALFEARETLTAEAQEALRGEDCFPYVETIQSGASEAQLLRAQRRLVSLFYLSESDLDGKFGPKTQEAISLFQTNNGLTATGAADEATQAVLYSADPIGNWTPYKLEISIAEQRVYAYQLNEQKRYELVDSFICSTGLGNSTPKGVFTRTQPLNRWHYFKKFECWAQYSWQIDGDILFHSVLYDRKDTSTLRRGSVYALGSKASHGCVRLKVEDAQWIYEHCGRGTIVVVY